ncbi:MAG: NUDIX domain-containing protein [Gemmatimonadetes bacterium]|nr:NUDIX domain-containing protein [Gemmatimonadota bacterium]
MPNLSASSAVIRSGEILLIKRRDIEVWCLPGGHVDPGETVSQAAVREVQEETGLQTTLDRLVGIYSAPHWHHGGDNVVLFAATPTTGELNPQENEVLDLGFFDPEQLPEPLAWWHKRRILDVFDGVGGSVARLQDMVWPFDPDWTRDKVYDFLAKSGLSKEEFYLKHWGQPGPEDGRIEVREVRKSD